MRHRRMFVSFLMAVLLAPCAVAIAAEPTVPPDSTVETVTIPTSVAPREVREYRVSYEIKGKGSGNWLVDTAVVYNIRHAYGRREGDDLLPMEITLLSGSMTTGGQKIDIAPGVYPKLTILLDRQWRIIEVYGTESRAVQNLRGVNYGNLILLFYPIGGDKPHAVGESWLSRTKLANLGEVFDITSTIKGVESVSGVQAAKVSQQIRPVGEDASSPKSKMKCEAESYFALADGRLLKSHVECEVEIPSPSSPPGSAPDVPAAVKINIGPLQAP